MSAIGVGYYGLSATAEIGALNRMLGEGPMISGVRIDLDPAGEAAFLDAVKATPQAGFLTIQKRSLERAARASGRSEAELIREGVELVTARHASAEPVLPLFESGQPDLAEHVDEALAGFGER